MNTMTYNGYSARIEYDDQDEIFVGHLAGIRDIVSFHGSAVEDLKAAFHEAVDHYLVVCEKRGETPQRPYSGNVMLRIPPETHAAAARAADLAGVSLNQWAADVFKRAAD